MSLNIVEMKNYGSEVVGEWFVAANDFVTGLQIECARGVGQQLRVADYDGQANALNFFFSDGFEDYFRPMPAGSPIVMAMRGRSRCGLSENPDSSYSSSAKARRLDSLAWAPFSGTNFSIRPSEAGHLRCASYGPVAARALQPCRCT